MVLIKLNWDNSVPARLGLKICSKWTWILIIWETIRNLSNHVLKPRFMWSAQSDITEPTYGICCSFYIKTACMFIISENYYLHGMDRIAHVLFACMQDDKILQFSVSIFIMYVYCNMQVSTIHLCAVFYMYVLLYHNKSNILCGVSCVRYCMYCIYVLYSENSLCLTQLMLLVVQKPTQNNKPCLVLSYLILSYLPGGTSHSESDSMSWRRLIWCTCVGEQITCSYGLF